jgi:hypothetical protein
MEQKMVILLLLGYSCLASAQSDIRISALSGVTRINLSWVSSPVKEKITPFLGLGFKYHVTPQKHPNLIGTIGINVFQKHNVLKYQDPGFLDTGNTFYSDNKRKVSFTQFEMPITVGYKINKISFFINSALGINAFGNSCSSWKETTNGISQQTFVSTKVENLSALSFSVGLSCSYSLSEKWSAGLLYSRTLTDFYDADLSNSKSRNSVFGISLDYRLKTY